MDLRKNQASHLNYGKLQVSRTGSTCHRYRRADPSVIAVELNLEPRRTPSGRISKRKSKKTHKRGGNLKFDFTV
jgi:hypothetical protein